MNTTIITENADAPREPAPIVDEESVDALADASVTVAAINAERDVELATIQADLERDVQAAITERTNRELETELEECRTQITTLKRQMELLTEAMTPPPSTAPPPNPTPPNVEDVGHEVTPDSPEAPQEAPPEAERKRARSRWI
jgi:uncharacterized coiled-coil protein SlyX